MANCNPAFSPCAGVQPATSLFSFPSYTPMSSLLIAGGAVNFGPSTVTTAVTVAVAGACACGAPANANNAATIRTLANTYTDLRITISSAGGIPSCFAVTWDEQDG